MGIFDQVGMNDGILLLSLAYSALDILLEWDNFRGCVQPIHWWLLVSYVFVISFRISHFVGNSQAAEGEDFLLNLRQQKTLPRVLVKLTWTMLLPIYAVWTVTGSIWFRDVMTYTPDCLPVGAHPWFIGFWQLLSYLWIIVHVVFGAIAWVLEKRLRTAESNIREIEDADSISRWGRMSSFSSYAALPWNKNAGLSPGDIEQLSTETFCQAGDEAECAICLSDFCEGDAIRRLPRCGHVFHKSCIDLWVLRRADCPLCKCQVGNCDRKHPTSASYASSISI
jgi:hypothetical protein